MATFRRAVKEGCFNSRKFRSDLKRLKILLLQGKPILWPFFQTPNGLEDWEVVTPSSGVEEMESSEEKTEASSVEEKTTSEQPSTSGKQEAWDGKIWSKYLSPNQ